MWKVGIRELKNRDLSRAIRRARQGEEIIVTDHGVPVAKIVSFDAGGPPAEIAELVQSKLIEYRAPVWEELGEPVPMLPGEKTATDYVREQRR
jgi:prevent-host-death family protein